MFMNLDYKPAIRLKLYDHLKEQNGEAAQVEKAREELEEVQDLLEIMSNNLDPRLDVAGFFDTDLPGEIADVLIMCEQLARIYSMEESVRVQFQYKINRQADRSGFDMSET